MTLRSRASARSAAFMPSLAATAASPARNRRPARARPSTPAIAVSGTTASVRASVTRMKSAATHSPAGPPPAWHR